MSRVRVVPAESSEKTSADQSSTPQVFRVTVETGIIQFSSVAGNSKSGPSTSPGAVRSGILLEAVRRVIVKVVGKVDLWAHVLRIAPSLTRAEVRLGPRGSAKRILEDAGCEAQKSSVAGNHFFLVPPKRFPGA